MTLKNASNNENITGINETSKTAYFEEEKSQNRKGRVIMFLCAKVGYVLITPNIILNNTLLNIFTRLEMRRAFV